LVNKDINISNSVGHHHWRILVKADKAADISSGVLYSRGMFFLNYNSLNIYLLNVPSVTD